MELLHRRQFFVYENGSSRVETRDELGDQRTTIAKVFGDDRYRGRLSAQDSAEVGGGEAYCESPGVGVSTNSQWTNDWATRTHTSLCGNVVVMKSVTIPWKKIGGSKRWWGRKMVAHEVVKTSLRTPGEVRLGWPSDRAIERNPVGADDGR